MNRIGQQGFTLIEMLATVGLIAIAMGGAVVFFTSQSPEQQLKKTIDQFIAVADHAKEFAMVKNETWGVQIKPPKWRDNPLDQGWLFQWKRLEREYDENLNVINQKWVKIEGIDAVDIPKEIGFNIVLDEILWEWENIPEVIDPLILFFPSGEITEFEIELIADDFFSDPQHIELNEWGEIVWRERQEALAEAEEQFGLAQ